jgi:competence protein ComFC
MLRRLIRFLLDLLFPPKCVFCGKIIPPGKNVCSDCAKAIAPCGSVRLFKLPWKKNPIFCATLYPYEGRVRESLLRYKFHGEEQNADYYAGELAALVKAAFPDVPVSLVTWVPLSKQRKKDRGYDQAERIARPLAKALHLPCCPCLVKVRQNRVQHYLGRRARAENVRGAYAFPGRNVAGEHILLVDDIVTTGATLAECAAVLLHGGAVSVCCAAVAQAELGQVEKSPCL